MSGCWINMFTGIPTGGNVHDFIEDSSALDSTCAVRKVSSAQQTPGIFCMREDDAQELSGVDTVASAFEPVCRDEISTAKDEEEPMRVENIVDSSPSGNNKREDIFLTDSLESSLVGDGVARVNGNDSSYQKCHIGEAYSIPCQRSGRHNILGEQNKNQKQAKSCMKTSGKKVLDLSSVPFTRKRRSALRKHARSTVWGLLGSITTTLNQNDLVNTSLKKPKSRRSRGVSGNRKQEKKKKVGDSLQLIKKGCTPSGPISLKIKFGKSSTSIVKGMTAVDDNKEEDFKDKKVFSGSSKGVQGLLKEEAPGSISFQSCHEFSEKASNVHLVNAEDIGRDGNTFDDLEESPSCKDFDKLIVTNDNRISYSGTSPDSEVINVTPDSQICEKDPEILCHALSLSDPLFSFGRVSSLSMPCKNGGKGKTDNDHRPTSGCCANGEVPSPEFVNDVQQFPKPGQKDKVGDISYYSDSSTSTTENASLTLNIEGLPKDLVPCFRVAELAISGETAKVESVIESNVSSGLGVAQESLESNVSDILLPCPKGKKPSKSSKVREEIKSSSKSPNSSSRKEKVSKTKRKQDKSSGKRKSKDKRDFDEIQHAVDSHLETGIRAFSGNKGAGECVAGNKNLTGDTSSKYIATLEAVQQCVPPSAWVSCDDCEKWRRIPVALADEINETKCRWVCKDNMDKNFADCSISQEMSNAEINAELEISDASCEEDACDLHVDSNTSRHKQLAATQHPSWTLIKLNLFLHRRRKNQTIDEIMVCHCKPPADGQVGCGDECLNRMLNIECIQGTCPCGESCSNQKFQKRKYAKLKSVKCGKKGYGLQSLEDVSEGQFLIEYVGEVLDMHAYEARQKEYAVKGHKHFYFMTLNGSEVIDACAKGNLGRFINHSCEPNCRTEKWMVNGEVCIGIFALRDIKKGEELTFDYNYVRVFGAAAKKCVCGSSQCRGYIGGDPLNAEEIVQSDSDEEYPEPVMVRGNGNMSRNLSKALSLTSCLNGKEIKTIRDPSKVDDQMDGSLSIGAQLDMSSEHATELSHLDKIGIGGSTTVKVCSEIIKERRESNRSAATALNVSESQEKESPLGQHTSLQPIGSSSQSGDMTSENIPASPEECSAIEKNYSCSNQGSDTNSPYKLSDQMDSKRKLKLSVGEVGGVPFKSHTSTKISKKSSSVKGKSKTNVVDVKKAPETVNKVQIQPFNPKRLLEALSNGRFEAVQEQLNELLDNDGGISKRKDASRGYLKLLFLTAASGDRGHGEAIQSNRDLSMILDAFLKTKSKTVLVDIINKNGLQMLHNIMKRYRKEYIKIPILRKLLKVLEYLATREIIKCEHINGGPRCPGVESFRDSILKLAEHVDKQVHQIARSFRDRWIPRHFRKFGCIDRDDSRMEFHQGSNCDRTTASNLISSDYAGLPSETTDCILKPVAATSAFDARMPEGSSGSGGTRKRKSRWDQPSKEAPNLATNTRRDGMDEDIPPGFSTPVKHPLLNSDAYSNDTDHNKERCGYAKAPYGMAMGHPQKRFISRLSVAYGVPISIVEQFGSYQAGTSENWVVAPGMPFQPFPPLPAYPRDTSKSSTLGQAARQAEQDSNNHATLDSVQNPPTTSGSAVGMGTPAAMNEPDFRRVGNGNLPRKYFRQQKWNSSMTGNHQIQKRNCWGSNGNNLRNGMCEGGFGSGPNKYNGSHRSDDISSNMQNEVNFHLHQPQKWH